MRSLLPLLHFASPQVIAYLNSFSRDLPVRFRIDLDEAQLRAFARLDTPLQLFAERLGVSIADSAKGKAKEQVDQLTSDGIAAVKGWFSGKS